MTQETFKGEAATSINPTTGEMVKRYPYQNEAEVESTLQRSRRGFEVWSRTLAADRVAVIRRVSAILRRDIDQIAKMATVEMGKPVQQARGEVEKCAVMCDWYAEHGESLVADQPSPIGPDAYVAYRPMGTVLAVMPWNFPFWQVLRGAVPVLVGGNGYLLKHAPNVMGCAYLVRSVLLEAGLPEGTFDVINVTNDLVSRVIADDRISAVTVTGSVRAGSAIAAQAGAALKKTVLELGGSDPFIVLADADLEGAVQAALVGRFQNTGQICIAAKRIILEKPIAEEFTARFVEGVKAMKLGDPMQEDTYLGPIARADLRDELHAQVQSSVQAGARLLLGGERPEGNGFYYPATVLADVRPGMAVFDRETFGPVASLIVADDVREAVELANNSDYGLSGVVWTENRELARQLAGEVETGGFFVNSFSASDPRVPIGGVKKSGYGRELSTYGVHEFMNVQTVWFDRK